MSDKNFKVKNGIDANGTITILQPTTSTIPLIIKANSVATGSNMLEMQRPDGTVRFAIANDGALTVNSNISFNGGNMTMYPGNSGQTALIVNGQTNQSVPNLIVKAATNQSGNLQEWRDQSNNLAVSVGPDFALRGVAGGFFGTANGNIVGVNYLGVKGWAADHIPFVVQAVASQTGDLTRWVDSSANTLAKVDANGSISAVNLTLSGNLTVNGTTTNLNSTNLVIEDKNIIIADVATPTDTTADGAGITIKGATDKTFNWVQSTGRFTSSEPIQATGLSVSTSTNTTNAGTFYNSAGTIVFNVDTSLNQINIGGGLSGIANNYASAWGYDSALNAGFITFQTGALGGDSLAIRRTNHVASGDYTVSALGNLRFSTASGKNFNFNSGNIGVGTTAIGTNNKIIVNPYSTVDNLATVQINTNAVTNKGLVIQGYALQTANLTEWQRSDGTVKTFIKNVGGANNDLFGWVNSDLVSATYLSPTGSTNSLISLTSDGTHIDPPNSSKVGLVIQGRASQSADLTQWTNSSGTVIAKIDANGDIKIGDGVYTSNNVLIATGMYSSYALGVGLARATGNANLAVSTGATANVGMLIRGVASQTANLQEWQDSAGTVLNTITSSGTLVIGGTTPVNSSFGITIVNKSLASYYSTNNSSYNTSFNFARGNTTGNWMGIGTVGDSTNGVASIAIADTGRNTIFTVGQTGNTAITLKSATSIGLVIKAAASQTANLQEWQNSAGTVTASVDPAGNITDASNTAWLSPIGSGSNDAPTIQALIDAGKKEIRLGSGQWTFSTRIKVPNGVTIRGTGTSRSSTTGTRVNAVALIASEGTVRDIMFTGAGENAQSELGGGGIAVLGGRVIDCSVNDSRWVLAPTRQPHGYLKNFMSRMQGGYGSVKVAILGDSLSENTSTTSWYGYLFDTSTTATGYYLGSYFGHQIAPSEVDNMAIGGQGAYLLSAQLAMTKDTVRTGGYQNQVLDGDNVSTAPFFNRNYNLAILAIGQNGGEDWKTHLEYTVKTIRDKGIDVIILTQNPAAGAPTSRAGDEYFYRSMAETYGCLLIDTQAYYRLEVEFGRALGTTADLFGDSIHQSTLGHQLYAKAILNGILDYDSTIAVPANKTVVSRSYIPAQTDRASVISGINTYYLVKKPDPLRDISGVTYTSATDSSIRNPIYGRGTTTNSVATLASGGYATWGVEYATAAYIIFRENSTSNTLTVSLQGGGSTLATLSTGVTDGRTSVAKVTLNGGYSANRPIRITNTSGNAMQIYGVVFETHADVAFNRNTDGSYPGVKLNGTWSSGYFLDMASYSALKTPYTSTVNDSVTFKFYGDGLRFATSYGKNSGIIQVKIDDTTYNAVDTYLNIGEYGVYTHFYGGLQYGLHTATITLTGANASVTNNLGDGARFGLHRIAAVRSGWYLTQDQQFAPNSDISANINSLASPVISSAGGANAVDLTIKGATTVGSGTTEKLISFKSSANSEIGYVLDTGYGATLSQFNYLYTTAVQGWNGVGGSINFANSTPITILPQSSSVTSLVTKGAASQTANIQEWQNSSATILAKMDASGNFSAISKSFDIEHPTKENMRLRYSSLEGPENGVYIRGTAECNIIELPDYWTGLVHEDSITVSLTSVGSAQNIYVEKIENNKIYIGGNLEKAFFTVYGERKDIDKLTVEY